MGDLMTRRGAVLALIAGTASCSSADDARVRVVVPSQKLGVFEAGLENFARVQRLRMRRDAEREYSLEGRGLYIFVLPSPPANETISFHASIITGLFAMASAERIDAIADALVEAMNSIDGLQGARVE
jgi:hypothetical protein